MQYFLEINNKSAHYKTLSYYIFNTREWKKINVKKFKETVWILTVLKKCKRNVNVNKNIKNGDEE